jgi:hypothetical protein
VGAQAIFGKGQTWSYFKGLSEPSDAMPAWRQLNFDDSTWLEGAGPIGFHRTLTLGTTLSDMSRNYTSVYFRKTFQIDDPSSVGGLTLQALYDDGINVWINGRHVARKNLLDFTDDLPFNAVAISSLSTTEYEDIALADPSGYLVAGTNVIAVQLFNQSASNSDAFFDARLLNTSEAPAGPSPGRINSIFATNAPPQMRQVDHTPREPKSGQDVTITVKVTDPDGVQGVTLDYQLVNPGDYIELKDPRYATEWTTVSMHDDGKAGDTTAGDSVFTAVLPAELQTHRRLVRYRISASDTLGNSVTGPYADDPQPNFAYFVYDGVPAWTGSWRPGVEPAVTYSSDLLQSLPVYQFITTRKAHEDALYLPNSETRSGYTGADYLWLGTMIYDGHVYDHVPFRARGGVWRYAMGKNMWKFDFNKGHSFQAHDDYGRPYDTQWDKLNFSAIIQQGDYLHRGEQGLFEAVGFKMFDLAGTESPKTNYVHFRVIENADENGPDQYSGDFQGMYMTLEQPDDRFLDEHGLPNANFYKIENDNIEGGKPANQGPYQVSDGSDVREFIRITERTTPDEQWWRDNVDLERYYGYQAVSEFIHHYDTAFGKNYYYLNNPETGKWQIHPWDLDLTWADNMFGDQNHDFNVKVADYRRGQSPFSPEYHNRVRELVDLLYNVEQTGLLIDEFASFIYTPGEPSFVDADRAMWDYNPMIAQPSRYTNPSKNAQRYHFYDRATTKDFPGMVQLMKDYVVRRTERFLFASRRPLVTTEPNVPTTPTITSTSPEGFPANALSFQASPFASPVGSTFAAIEWRLAEITDPANPQLYTRTTPIKYEIEAPWESGEITQWNDSIQIPGGAVEPGKLYRARVRMKDSAGLWSHWSQPVQFVAGNPVGDIYENLRITEINYNPHAELNSTLDNDQFEFIELANVGSTTLDLTGIRFADGIEFQFAGSAMSSLGSGERAVVVRNKAAFESRYGNGMRIAGPFTSGGLNNGGEQLSLVDSAGTIIQQFTYGDAGPWPNRADGGGSSLEVIDTAGNYNDPSNWRSSADYGGSPGTAGNGRIVDVVINELLTNTDAQLSDTIELYNTTNVPIDISGWFLSDALGTLKKFAIPSGTVIPSGGYVTFDESRFNSSGDVSRDFALSGELGDDVWLVAADRQGNLLRFVDHVEFGPAESGVSFGRWPNGTGPLSAMQRLTLGSANSPPRTDVFVPKAGDANEDRQFNQADIVLVLQGGKYLTGQPATWSQGDWNEDGRFDQKDIVAALQTGTYLQGPYAAEAVAASASNLRITEINYNPHSPLLVIGERDTPSDDFEFIELANVGTQPINLEGVKLVPASVGADMQGVAFNFAAQMLEPGQHLVVIKNRAAFVARYGQNVRIAAGNDGSGGADGQFGGGRLSNNTEQLTLVDRTGRTIQQFTYNDSGNWPGRADGNGSTLEISDTSGDPNDPNTWRSSSEFGGSPGAPGKGPDNRIVFNEVLAHTDPPDVDMIELFNMSGEPINVANWYLSDSSTDYFKFKISGPATIAAGGYYVLSETTFGTALGRLSSYRGEDLWLIEADARGKPVRFVDRVQFGATERGVSVGRWPNATGRLFPMAQLTLGAENTGPLPGDVIISELHYNPVDPDGSGPLVADTFEFIELYNRSISAVDVTNWRLEGGVQFTFAAGTLISPGETVVVVPFVPENTGQVSLFRTTYGVSGPLRLIGPYAGVLANGGEAVRLEWPDAPPAEQPDFIPFILEDQIDYDDDPPWPASPDAQGDALARTAPEAFSDTAQSWTAQRPTPGTTSFFVREAGDSNEDRQFDQRDIILVLQGAKYLTREPATWAQGDWNGDQLFDQKDIIAALQTGNYLKGPYAAIDDRALDAIFEQLGDR